MLAHYSKITPALFPILVAALLASACSDSTAPSTDQVTGADSPPTAAPTSPPTGSGGVGGGGNGGGGSGGQVANVVGSWDATNVEGNPIGQPVNYSGYPSVITEAALGMNGDGTWTFYVYADVPGQTGGGIGAGPMRVIDDNGTYTVQPQLAANGLTIINLASQAYPGYRLVGGTDGQNMTFSYQMTTSQSSYLDFDFKRR